MSLQAGSPGPMLGQDWHVIGPAPSWCWLWPVARKHQTVLKRYTRAHFCPSSPLSFVVPAAASTTAAAPPPHLHPFLVMAVAGFKEELNMH